VDLPVHACFFPVIDFEPLRTAQNGEIFNACNQLPLKTVSHSDRTLTAVFMLKNQSTQRSRARGVHMGKSIDTRQLHDTYPALG
jgi:hypothetical protein